MRTTTDTYTGRAFRYTGSTEYLGLSVPCRYTTRVCMVLAPDRVPLPLLQRLNPGVELLTRQDVITIQRQHMTLPEQHALTQDYHDRRSRP